MDREHSDKVTIPQATLHGRRVLLFQPEIDFQLTLSLFFINKKRQKQKVPFAYVDMPGYNAYVFPVFLFDKCVFSNFHFAK